MVKTKNLEIETEKKKVAKRNNSKVVWPLRAIISLVFMDYMSGFLASNLQYFS